MSVIRRTVNTSKWLRSAEKAVLSNLFLIWFIYLRSSEKQGQESIILENLTTVAPNAAVVKY